MRTLEMEAEGATIIRGQAKAAWPHRRSHGSTASPR